ncbi:hypothetical protein FRC03_006924 [Tulasnella sp. 419]|nr:hypothetical protein FRC03_006924 [Tulasnella sp. 419]
MAFIGLYSTSGRSPGSPLVDSSALVTHHQHTVASFRSNAVLRSRILVLGLAPQWRNRPSTLVWITLQRRLSLVVNVAGLQTSRLECRLRKFTRNLDGIWIHSSRTMKQNNGFGIWLPSSTSTVGVFPLSSSLNPATGTRYEAMTMGQHTSNEAMSNPTPVRHLQRNNKFEEGATSLDDSSSVPPPREI